ncbi:hypothetical protein [Methanofollis sp. UBA420]|jgi:large-conductance mechanosensitive channel|uniref:hypothetical protein n=1 Tax=Methanofollis sp. UBA420 TaxID=1915514 RepID=UPI00316ADAF0
MKLNDLGVVDGTIILAIMGFIVGAIIGEVIQVLITQVVFPDITSAITSACPVEGAWKEAQENVIDCGRIAIDTAFGVGGALSFVTFLNTTNRY